MTAEQEQAISEANEILRQVGYTIETIIQINESGEKIGAPLPPKPRR